MNQVTTEAGGTAAFTPFDWQKAREQLVRSLMTSKDKFNADIRALKSYDEFLETQGIQPPGPRVGQNVTDAAPSNTNGRVNGATAPAPAAPAQARTTETAAPAKRAAKKGATSKTKTGGDARRDSDKERNGGLKAGSKKGAAKAGSKKGSKKTSTKVAAKTSAKKTGTKKAAGQKKSSKKGASAHPAPRSSGLTLKEAMCKVIGDKQMKSTEVWEGLQKIGHVPDANDPKTYVAYVLSSEPEIFPRAARGVYRADPSKLPQIRGRAPTGKAAPKAAGKESGSSVEPGAAKATPAPQAVAKAVDADDPDKTMLEQLGYNPATDAPLFAQ